LIQDGDLIEIDILTRKIDVLLSDAELDQRRKKELEKGNMAYLPNPRDRQVSKALRAYASMVSSADRGAIRLIE
jgi:dihydroxy-acid dehydratase